MAEIKQEALDRGVGIIRKNYQNTANKGRITEQNVEDRMALLEGHLDKSVFRDVDMVIEAVFEEMEVKKTMFAELDKICKPGVILASNTSYLNVNEIARVTSRPADVVLSLIHI